MAEGVALRIQIIQSCVVLQQNCLRADVAQELSIIIQRASVRISRLLDFDAFDSTRFHIKFRMLLYDLIFLMFSLRFADVPIYDFPTAILQGNIFLKDRRAVHEEVLL